MLELYCIIYMYSDTVSRTGVYCSVSIALEQCKIEGVVDVFQITKAVKRSKPGAVTTLVIYLKCMICVNYNISFLGAVHFNL